MPPWSFVFGMLGWLLPDFGHHHLQNRDNKTRRWVLARVPPDAQVSQKFKYVGWLRGEQRTLVLAMSAIYSAVKGIQAYYQKGIGARLAMAKLKCGSRIFAGPAGCCSSFLLRDDSCF